MPRCGEVPWVALPPPRGLRRPNGIISPNSSDHRIAGFFHLPPKSFSFKRLPINEMGYRISPEYLSRNFELVLERMGFKPMCRFRQTDFECLIKRGTYKKNRDDIRTYWKGEMLENQRFSGTRGAPDTGKSRVRKNAAFSPI